jgi:hypothetical protein
MTRDLARTFDEIQQAGAFDVSISDYAELFHAAIAERKIYRAPSNARVRIFGLLEARLQTVDRLVLGGLVEGVWPPEARADPWLSRPMRRDLKLDLPERRIGLSAHDFDPPSSLARPRWHHALSSASPPSLVKSDGMLRCCAARATPRSRANSTRPRPQRPRYVLRRRPPSQYDRGN